MMLAVVPAASVGACAFVKTDAEAALAAARPNMAGARAASSVWMCLFIAGYLTWTRRSAGAMLLAPALGVDLARSRRCRGQRERQRLAVGAGAQCLRVGDRL